jgi:potassium-dependent mechanosensitive channel
MILRDKFDKLFCHILAWSIILAASSGIVYGASQIEDVARQFNIQEAEWQKTLEQSAKLLGSPILTKSQRENLHKQLQSVRKAALEVDASAKPQLSSYRELLTALGPPPKKDESPEAPELEAERHRINESIMTYDGQVKRAALIAAKADALLRNLDQRELAWRTRQLFKRGLSSLSPGVWTHLPGQLATFADELQSELAWGEIRESFRQGWRKKGAWFLIILVAALAAGWFFRRWLLLRFGPHKVAKQPSFRRRIVATAAEGIGKGLLPAIPILAVTVVLLITSSGKLQVSPPLLILIYFFFFSGLVRAALAPKKAIWRIAPIEDVSARLLAHRTTVLAAVVALERMTVALTAGMVLPAELVTARGCLVILFVVILFTILPRRLWCVAPEAASDSTSGESQSINKHFPENKNSHTKQGRAFLPRTRFFVGLFALIAAGSCLAGYQNLAEHIYVSLITGFCLAVLLLLTRGIIREVVPMLHERTGRIAAVESLVGLSDSGVNLLEHWTLIILDVLLALVAIFLLLPLVALNGDLFDRWIRAIWDGFVIGNIRISPMSIATALLAFSIVLFITRFIQRMLSDRVFPILKLDVGVQNSIRTGFGYLGIVIAILSGVSTLGLNLSSLTIIAGALSIGMGFGLQNVVSNFIAGLILLIERPVKVGDWVVVGTNQGIIKRIRVRATELQTFDHAEVIIPNSEMVSNAVINWTHKDRERRLNIPIGVSYGSDLEKVRQILLDCAAAEKRIASSPEPQALLQNFGDSAVEFELRCFIYNVDDFVDASTDLRFAIWHAFNENGIEIPYPQRVIHIPEIHGLQTHSGAEGEGQARTTSAASARPD